MNFIYHPFEKHIYINGSDNESRTLGIQKASSEKLDFPRKSDTV